MQRKERATLRLMVYIVTAHSQLPQTQIQLVCYSSPTHFSSLYIHYSSKMGCGLHRRVHATEISQRFLSAPTVQPYLEKCKLQLVSDQEARFLTKLFRDLASRSGGDTLDRYTFLQFFPLPVTLLSRDYGESVYFRSLTRRVEDE